MKKILNWAICTMLLIGCQSTEIIGTPVNMIQTEVLSPVSTPTSLPSHTLTPLSPSPTIAPAQMPLERVTFTVATHFNEMFFDTVIAFANSDGTDFETPGLFEPFRDTGGVSGKHLVWSPDGRYLAFDGADKIMECGAPNTDCTTNNYGTFLLDYSQGLIIQYVESTLTNSSWSPDSRELVLSIDEKQPSRSKSDMGDLYIFDMKGGRKTELTKHPSNDLYPSWSPDGQWIAFIRYTPNPKYCSSMPSSGSFEECDNASLYVIHPDGTGLKLLAEPIHVEAPIDGRDRPYNAPGWSPDSQWLTVMAESEGLPSIINQEIASVNIETGELRRLTNNNALDIMPVWSPDGRYIAFVSNRDGNEEIYVMNIDGTETINLSQNPALDYAPVWSSSGSYIAFISSRGSVGHKLYVMNADGKKQTLINGEYLDITSRPSWLPIVRP